MTAGAIRGYGGLAFPSWTKKHLASARGPKFEEKKTARKPDFSLYFLERPTGIGKKSVKNRKKYYQERFDSNKWNFVPNNKQYKKNYKIFNNKTLFVFINSTLGYEALSRGKKIVTIQTSFPFRGHPANYSKSGFFWSNKLDYLNLEKILNRVLKISNNKWKKVAKKYSNNLVCFDENNRHKLNIINKILKS